jgi:hypothetical protein
MRKYSIYIALLVLVLVVVGVILISRPNQSNKTNVGDIKLELQRQFSQGMGHTVSVKTASGTFSGQLNSTDFKGSFKSGSNLAASQIVSLDGKNYVSDVNGKNWENNSAMFSSQINMVTHPEWIQIQKQLPGVSKNGKSYHQYEILFENPDQDITKNMSEDLHNKFGYFGIILVDTDTLQLKQMKIHAGKEEPKDKDLITTIEYSEISNPPDISIPKMK